VIKSDERNADTRLQRSNMLLIFHDCSDENSAPFASAQDVQGLFEGQCRAACRAGASSPCPMDSHKQRAWQYRDLVELPAVCKVTKTSMCALSKRIEIMVKAVPCLGT